MIRSTVPLVLLAMLGGGALGLWVSAPTPHPATSSPSTFPAPATPVQQQRPTAIPQAERIYPAVGQRGTAQPFEADV